MACARIFQLANASVKLKRAGLIYRSRLSASLGRCTTDIKYPVPAGIETYIAGCPTALATGQHRACRLCTGCSRSWHGNILALQPHSGKQREGNIVRTALNVINQTLTEVLSEVEDEFDFDTRWAIAWFEQYGFSEGDFGDAEILSKAKVTSVSGLQLAGIVVSKGGKVRLLRPSELPADWDPQSDRRLTVWEMTHHLLRVYHHQGAGDEATSALLRELGSNGELARDLAYRLFKVSEKKKLPQEALGYNALVLGWPEISRLARQERIAPAFDAT